MPVWETGLAMVVYLIACALQGAVGFGANLFAVPLLALINPSLVPVPVLLVSPVLNGLMTWRERGHVEKPILTWTLLGRLPGVALGVVALQAFSCDRLGVLFGVLLLLAVGLKVSGLAPQRSKKLLLGAGGLSGFMATTVGVGGPPVALTLHDLDGPSFRATMSPYFLIGTSMSVVGLALGGQITGQDFVTALWLAPAVVAGVALSGPLRSRFDAGRVSTSVYVLSAVAAVALLLRSLL